jgi:hypothetical protein
LPLAIEETWQVFFKGALGKIFDVINMKKSFKFEDVWAKRKKILGESRAYVF